MKTIDIKGKPYVTVSERVKAIRKQYGFDVSIETWIHTLGDNYVVMGAKLLNSEGRVLSTGYAKEKEGDTFINKGSHIENCETSAVGRCLAFAGYGISAEIASADEVIQNDLNSMITDGQKKIIENLLHDCTIDERRKVKIEQEMFDMTYSRAEDCIEYLTNNLPDQIESGRNYNQGDISRKIKDKLNDEKA